MRQLRLALGSAALAIALSPAVASAAPPISFILDLECSDESSIQINFGAPKNQGTALFVLDGNSILTTNYYHLEINDQVVIHSIRGMQGLGDQELLTCWADIDLGGDTWSWELKGWITPRT